MSPAALSHVFAALAKVKSGKVAFRSGIRLVSGLSARHQEKTLHRLSYTAERKMFKAVERGCLNTLDYRVYIGIYSLHKVKLT